MINYQVASLMKLTSLDNQLSDLLKQKNKMLMSLEEHEAHLQNLKNVAYESKNAIEKQTALVNRLELDMASLESQRKDIIKKRDLLKTTREFESLQKAEDALRIKQTEVEDELLDAWQQLESLQGKQKIADQRFAQAVEEHQSRIAHEAQEIEIIEARVKSLEQEKKGMLDQITDEVRAIYVHIAAHMANPIAVIQNESCSACFHTMTNKDMTDLRRCKIMQCKGCARLLYLADMVEAS